MSSQWVQPSFSTLDMSRKPPSPHSPPYASRCLEILVQNPRETPEAFLNSLEASSGRVQRAAVQDILGEDFPLEQTTGAYTGTGPVGNPELQPPTRSQGHKMWKMKVEFNTVQAATQAFSRLQLNILNVNANDNVNGLSTNNSLLAHGSQQTVSAQQLSAFILEDNDQLLDFRNGNNVSIGNGNVHDSPVSPWGKRLSPTLLAQKIDGGYGDLQGQFHFHRFRK